MLEGLQRSQLLPAVEDGCAALVVQLQVRGDHFSSQGLEEYGGADSYFSLMVKKRQSNANSKSTLRDSFM